MPYTVWPRTLILKSSFRYPKYDDFAVLIDELGEVNFSLNANRVQALNQINQVMFTNAVKLSTVVSRNQRFPAETMLVDVHKVEITGPLNQVRTSLMLKSKDKDPGVKGTGDMPDRAQHNDSQQSFINSLRELQSAILTGHCIIDRLTFEADNLLEWHVPAAPVVPVVPVVPAGNPPP